MRRPSMNDTTCRRYGYKHKSAAHTDSSLVMCRPGHQDKGQGMILCTPGQVAYQPMIEWGHVDATGFC
jgi:hypothetical protein